MKMKVHNNKRYAMHKIKNAKRTKNIVWYKINMEKQNAIIREMMLHRYTREARGFGRTPSCGESMEMISLLYKSPNYHYKR